MSTTHNHTSEAERKLTDPIFAGAVRLYRQPGGSLGPVEPLTQLEIKKLLAILDPAMSNDDPQVTLLSVNLHWGIVHFIRDVIGQAHGHANQKRKFLQQVISDPETALAGHNEPTPTGNSLSRIEIELSVHRARAAHHPVNWLAEAPLLARLIQEAAARFLRTFRGRDARRDYALASFLAVVIYIVEEFGNDLKLPQHSDDRGGTTVLFEFAAAALELAAAKGVALAPKNSTDPATASYRDYRRKPTASRSAFIKNLEAARAAAASARGKA